MELIKIYAYKPPKKRKGAAKMSDKSKKEEYDVVEEAEAVLEDYIKRNFLPPEAKPENKKKHTPQTNYRIYRIY